MHFLFPVLSAATIIAAVAAQSQLGGPSLVPDEVLTANGGSLNIERRQEISVVEMSTQLEAMASEISSFRASMAGGSSPLLMGIQAIANDMTARSNNLLTMTTANSIGLASIQTTVDSAQAAMTVQGQAIQAAVAAQGEEISANVASQAVAIAADTSTQLASAAEQIALTRTQLAAVQSSLAAATTSIGSEITAATSNITALQLRSAGKMVGYAQCEHRGENGADSSSTIVLTCTFRKTRSDTFWVISHNADTRQISGSSNWRIEVDGQPCTDRSNNRKGSIDAAFHGVGPNMHRPMYVRGICYRTANQAVIRPGNHAVRWRQIRTSGDSYWGWNSNSRIMVEEWLP